MNLSKPRRALFRHVALKEHARLKRMPRVCWTVRRYQSSEAQAQQNIEDRTDAAFVKTAHDSRKSVAGSTSAGDGSTPANPRSLRSPDPSQHLVSLRMGGRTFRFDPIYLRDSCGCPKCVDPSTRQKQFSTIDIPRTIKAADVTSDQDGFVIKWSDDVRGFDDQHHTRLSLAFVGRIGGILAYDYAKYKTAWGGEFVSGPRSHLFMNYEDYMADDTNLSTALMQLQKFGLVFIRGLPDTEQAVVDVANRIGPLKNTFYGLTWNVRSVPNAKNVAYTHQDLGFHMDLLYMHQPPRLQLLHCLRASTSGGASLFTDAYRAVVKMLQNHRKEFDVLRSIDVNYHYDNDSQHYFQSRPVIQLKPDTPSDVLAPSGNDNPHAILPFIEAVNWSPPFQGPFGWKSGGNNALNKNVRAWHRAARIFRNLVEAKGAVYERQMAPGECVIFDNRRVLHARTAFKVDDIGKERWLKGAYLDWDPWVSKMRVLGRDVIAKKTASNVDPEDDGQPAKGEQDAQEDVNLDLAGLRTHFNEMGRRASNS